MGRGVDPAFCVSVGCRRLGQTRGKREGVLERAGRAGGPGVRAERAAGAPVRAAGAGVRAGRGGAGCGVRVPEPACWKLRRGVGRGPDGGPGRPACSAPTPTAADPQRPRGPAGSGHVGFVPRDAGCRWGGGTLRGGCGRTSKVAGWPGEGLGRGGCGGSGQP